MSADEDVRTVMSSKKRKQGSESESDDERGIGTLPTAKSFGQDAKYQDKTVLPTQPEPKRRKKAKKRKRNFEETDTFNEELCIDEAYAHMSSSLLADQISQRTGQFSRDLSSVELDDLRISESAIRDTSSFSKPRTVDNLPDFLRLWSSDDPSKTSKAKASPHTIVIASSGILCADLTRSLRAFEKTKETPILKLFAKHQKITETAEKLRKSRTPIVVGTPQRILDLIQQDHLKINGLRRILVYASHIDEKKRGILSMKDVFKPLVQLLTTPKIKSSYSKSTQEERTELLFY